MKVNYTETVVERMARLPPVVLNALDARLSEFELDPVNRSTRSGPPYPKGGMLYRTFIPVGTELLFFTFRWHWVTVDGNEEIDVFAIGPDDHWDGPDGIALDID